MSQPYALFGFVRAKPEKAAELEALLLSFVAPTRQEAGCLEYHFHRDQADPALFGFYEVWRSRADLDRHMELPLIRSFLDRRGDYLVGDLDIHWLDMQSPYPRAIPA
ncbi:antibiotic biosynthesis monooxygenase [Neisseriaceae bacterium JH1-16]|nr:antibiotic biosynthesis monooxygenase [Neisseriaceae bacterium JH1-16]